jgi:hypothetical protein
MTGIMGKSISFWKNDMKMSNLRSPCCCKDEEMKPDELKQPDPVQEEVLKLEFSKKSTIKFQTVRDELTTGNKSTAMTININKSDTISSSELKEKKKYNDWSNEEDMLLVRLCNSHYYKKWKKIASIIGNGKTPRICAYRIKKLEKTMDLTQFKNNKVIKEEDKMFKDSGSIRSSDKTSSIFEFKKRKKLRKLVFVVSLIFYSRDQIVSLIISRPSSPISHQTHKLAVK